MASRPLPPIRCAWSTEYSKALSLPCGCGCCGADCRGADCWALRYALASLLASSVFPALSAARNAISMRCKS